MAQYTVTAGGCGHTTTLQLFGANKERTRRIDWAESPTGLCKACYAASKRASETSEHERAVVAEMARFRAALASQGKVFDADFATLLRSQIAGQRAKNLAGSRVEAVERILTEEGY